MSELDYAACAKCGKPKTVKRTKGLKPSEYCASGGTPTAAPIRCASWKQAAAFCRLRGAELPTREELNSVGRGQTSSDAVPEWSAERPRRGQPAHRQFRCVVRK